jgi:hypothetical protein
MKISKQTFLILAAMVTYGCKKPAATAPGNGSNQLGGTYTGQLVADYKASDPWGTGPVTSNVTVSFANRNYGAVTIPSTRYFGGYRGTADSGKYVLQSNQLTLADPAAYPQFFDQNLILEGSYSVVFKGDSLILNKTIYGNDYTYKLKKD